MLTCTDVAAARAGLGAGMALADARAMRPDLAVFEAEPERDANLLDAIAAWCERYAPVVVCDAPDGLFIDIAGCAHFFGSEDALLADLHARLRAQNLHARAAIAPSPGAAWALARFSRDRIADAENIAALLAPLPAACLRLPPQAAALLQRLGLKTVRHLIAAPRPPLAARAGEAALLRLDQALGRAQEALTPRRPPPPVFAHRRFLEPLTSLDAIRIGAGAACDDLAAALDARGLGARRLQLSLFGVDSKVRTFALGLSRPERRAHMMLRLLREKLNAGAENLDAEFGIEMLRLEAGEITAIDAQARELSAAAGRDAHAIARLGDTLSARLGAGRVRRIVLRPAHAPEDTEACAPLTQAPAASQQTAPGDGVMRRPLRLFARPERIDAIATVPDGPPLKFRWRRVLRDVVRAEGPERIAMNWLTQTGAPTRDYYRVEDEAGRRYWLYREGLYGRETDAPRWYVHGLFA